VNILIVTPVYGAFDILQKCCDAVDQNTLSNFFHVLVDDNSPTLPPILVTANRIIISLHSDHTPVHYIHIGKCLDIGMDFGRRCVKYDYAFILESDLVVQHGWDVQLVEELHRLPDAIAVDAFPVDGQGQPTYPCDGGKPIAQLDDAEEVEFMPTGCTVLSPLVTEYVAHHNGAGFSLYNHVDIGFARRIKTSIVGKFYRTQRVKVIHYASSSRNFLVASGIPWGYEGNPRYDPSRGR